MERLDNEQRTGGITAAGVRTWGVLFLLAGIAGRCVIQNGMLGLQTVTPQQLLDAMNASSSAMILVTVSLVCQLLEACAIPLFAFLLVEGFTHTASLKNYILRVAALALLSEIPYNLAIGGSWLVTDSRNPVFGILVCQVVLYLYRHFRGKGNVVIKVIVTLAAVFWCRMLNIEHGAFLVLLTAALWFMRDHKKYRVFVGCIAAVLGCLFSVLYMAAPMSFMILHFYNEEKGEGSRAVSYLCYPVLLLAAYGVVLFARFA